MIHIGVSIVGGIIIIGMTCYSVWQHMKHWVEPEAQRKIVPILLYPIINLLLYGIGGVLLSEGRSFYIEQIGEIYASSCLYLFHLLILYYYKKKAATHYGIEDRFCHRDKCAINDSYKDRKLEELFALSTEETYILPLTQSILWANIGGHLLTLLLSSILYEIGIGEKSLPWLEGINTGLLIASVASLFLLISLLQPVISIYHPTIKLLFLGGPILLLSLQSFLLVVADDELIPIRNTLVCGEMIILSISYHWVFPSDERFHTSEIHVTHVNSEQK
jgi:hypothetical protein